MLSSRRFPIRWSDEDSDATFIVKHNNGRKLADVYYEYYGEEPGPIGDADLLPSHRSAVRHMLHRGRRPRAIEHLRFGPVKAHVHRERPTFWRG
jgi:hypothetical protein